MLALSSHPKNNNNRYEGTTHLSFKTTCLFPWLAFARMFATIFSVLSSADSINNLSVLLLLKKRKHMYQTYCLPRCFNSPLRLTSLKRCLTYKYYDQVFAQMHDVYYSLVFPASWLEWWHYLDQRQWKDEFWLNYLWTIHSVIHMWSLE